MVMGCNQQGTLCPNITWRQFGSSQEVNRDLSAKGRSCDSVEIHFVLSMDVLCPWNFFDPKRKSAPNAST